LSYRSAGQLVTRSVKDVGKGEDERVGIISAHSVVLPM